MEYMTSCLNMQRRGLAWAKFQEYDDEFRRRRQLRKGRWNSFDPCLWSEVLVPVEAPVEKRKAYPKSWGNDQKPSGNQERKLCRFFNNQRGCRDKENCPHLHRCAICKDPHHNKFACEKSRQVRD